MKAWAGGSLQDEQPPPMSLAPARLRVFEKSTGGLAAGQAVELEVPIEGSNGALQHAEENHRVHGTSTDDGK